MSYSQPDLEQQVAGLEYAMDLLVQDQIRPSQIRILALTLAHFVEHQLSGEHVKKETRDAYERLHGSLHKLERWCALHDPFAPGRSLISRAATFVRRIGMDSPERAMSKFRTNLDDELADIRELGLYPEVAHFDPTPLFSTEIRRAEFRHLETMKRFGHSLRGPGPTESLHAASQVPEAHADLDLPQRVRLNDGPDVFETLTVYRYMTITVGEQTGPDATRVLLTSHFAEFQDQIILFDAYWAKDRYAIKRTRTETQRAIKSGEYVVDDLREPQVDSFTGECKHSPIHWISCVLYADTVQLTATTHYPQTVMDQFAVPDLTVWVKMSFGETNKSTAKGWFDYLMALYKGKPVRVSPPTSANVTVTSRSPGTATLRGGELFHRLLGGRGMSAIQLSATCDAPNQVRSAEQLSRPFKLLYGRTVVDLRQLDENDAVVEWTYEQPGHDPQRTSRKATRLHQVHSEVIREMYSFSPTNETVLEVVQRELHGSETVAEKWLMCELHELADRYDEGESYGRGPGMPTEAATAPQYHDIYVTPHEAWRLVREARRNRGDRFALLLLDVRPVTEFVKGHIAGHTVNIDPAIFKGLPQFVPAWHIDNTRHPDPEGMLRSMQDLSFRMLQDIRKSLMHNSEALAMFDSKHLYRHVLVYDEDTQRFPRLPINPPSPARTLEGESDFVLNNLYGAISDGPWRGSPHPQDEQRMMRKRPLLLCGGWEAWRSDIGEQGILRRPPG